ncbi:MAG: hypothetical protein M5U22_23455 [Thermoleophilia bacterium]|nr:hypothetical protein [Thermoleophilia bacterium]
MSGTVNHYAAPYDTRLLDHGKAEPVLVKEFTARKKVFRGGEALGVDYRAATDRLGKDGIGAFSESYLGIPGVHGFRRRRSKRKKAFAVRFSLNGFGPPSQKALEEVGSENFLERLWAQAPTLWKPPQRTGSSIKRRFRWVALADVMDDHVGDIGGFAREIEGAGVPGTRSSTGGGSALRRLSSPRPLRARDIRG